MPNDPLPPCPVCGGECEVDEELVGEDVSYGWVLQCLRDDCPYIVSGCSERCVKELHRLRCERDDARKERDAARDWLSANQFRASDYTCIGCGATKGQCGQTCEVARVVGSE